MTSERIGRADYELGADTSRLKRDLAGAEGAIRSSGATAERAFGQQGTAAAGKLGQAQGLLVKQSAELKKGMLAGVGFGAGVVGFMAVSKAVGMVTDAIGDTIGKAAAFQDAMTKSLAIMGDEMRAKMERAARDVALATTFSAKQAADAYFYLASAGMDATQSIEAMPRVAKFAQAGNFDLARATDLLTDAQSALGLTIRDDVVKNMENMSRVSDVLVRANTLANATVEQFSTSLTNKGAAALRLVNKEIEEGVAVLATWADMGVKGAEAGTRLDIVLRDLANAAIKKKAAFEEMGIAVFDADGNMRHLADIVEDMETTFDGMSTRQTRATLAMLGFQSKTVSATTSLLGTSKAIRGYEADLRNATGYTDRVAAKQLESFNAQMALLDSAIDEVKIGIGLGLLPVLTGMAVAIKDDVIPAAGGLVDSLQAIQEKAIEAKDALNQMVGRDLENDVANLVRITGTLGVALISDAAGEAGFALEDLGRQLGLGEKSFNTYAAAITRTRADMAGLPPVARAAADAIDDAIDPQAEADAKRLADAMKVATGSFKDVRTAAQEAGKAIRKALEKPGDENLKSIKSLTAELRRLEAQERRAYQSGDSAAHARIQTRRLEVEALLVQRQEARDAFLQERAEIKIIAQQTGISVAQATRVYQRHGKDAAAAVEAITRKQERQKAEVVSTTGAVGKATKATGQYGEKWKTVPDDSSTTVTTPGLPDATRSIEALKTQIGLIPSSKTITITANIRKAQGIYGNFHEGGHLPRGKWGIVGERGPELVRFGQPAQIISSTESSRLLAGQTGQASTPQRIDFYVHDPDAGLARAGIGTNELASMLTEAAAHSSLRYVSGRA